MDDLRAFKQVAVMKSFASAARALGLPRSTVSRNVARLERELGARLFQRTTREVALTPTGEALLQRCAGMLDALEDAVDQVRCTTAIPHGPLRVTTGVGFGVNVLAQELPEFLVRYPGVTVSLDLSTEKKDLVAEADVANPTTCEPVPYLGSLGLSDVSGNSQKTQTDQFAKWNGCTIETLPTAPNGGHVCTNYKGCPAAYPVRWCSYDGGHTPSPNDAGKSSSWMPAEVWPFLSQF